METIFSDGLEEPFDLTDFEELVGELSYAIVVFPEGAGSYAETGYFSAFEKLARKCILVLDFNQQEGNSFISLGPAKKISEWSQFYPNLYLDYSRPNFDSIAEKVRTGQSRTNKKSLSLEKFSDLSPYEIAAALHAIVTLCTIATSADIIYLITAIFKNRFSSKKVRRLLPLLVGSGYLLHVGPYGHFASNPDKLPLATVRDGFRGKEADLRLMLAEIYQSGDQEFLGLVEESRNAD